MYTYFLSGCTIIVNTTGVMYVTLFKSPLETNLAEYYGGFSCKFAFSRQLETPWNHWNIPPNSNMRLECLRGQGKIRAQGRIRWLWKSTEMVWPSKWDKTLRAIILISNQNNPLNSGWGEARRVFKWFVSQLNHRKTPKESAEGTPGASKYLKPPGLVHKFLSGTLKQSYHVNHTGVSKNSEKPQNGWWK